MIQTDNTMYEYDEKTSVCSLNRIFGFNPRMADSIIAELGSASAAFGIGGARIAEMTGSLNADLRKINDIEYEQTEKELQNLGRQGIRFLCKDEIGYPPLLKECADAPLGLYIKSESHPEEIFCGKCVSIVGTRDLSPYGREWCERIVSALASTGISVSIISGLAIGTDITAHRKAISSGLRTAAILPTGIDSVYPARHYADADIICRSPGCALITDYPPLTSPKPVNFIRRNRIIAGISSATILIESKVKGGGMITARLAFSYDRDVYALQGRADDIRSQGCNLLIKEKIAEPILSELSLTEALGAGRCRQLPEFRKKEISDKYESIVGKDKAEVLADILLMIKRNRGITIEEIAEKKGINYKIIAGCIGILECDGLVSVDLMQRCTIIIQ